MDPFSVINILLVLTFAGGRTQKLKLLFLCLQNFDELDYCKG